MCAILRSANTMAKSTPTVTPHILIQFFAALRQSVGLLGRFITVWKNRTGHTHTHTHTTTVTLRRMRADA